MSHPALHEGELEIQRRLGVVEAGGRVAHGIHPFIPPVAERFLSARPFAVAAVVDEERRPWATLWSGRPGFIGIVDQSTVRVSGEVLDGLTAEKLKLPGNLGLLAIDLETRRRMRLNGRAARVDGGLEIQAKEVYANCPKYIQKRNLDESDAVTGPAEIRRGLGLDDELWERITTADTFFTATAHPERGADASHRGGRPGFVRRIDGSTLEFEDYSGNNLFNTLGNLVVNPKMGLLFVDFELGDTLHLTGRTTLLQQDAARPGRSGVSVRLEVEEWIEQRGLLPWRGALVEPSPFNPPH